MKLRSLWLVDYRGYDTLELSFPDGLTVVSGRNGHGKTNLVEAIAWLATLKSFRGAPTEALVRADAEFAVVRGQIENEGREILIETQLVRGARVRAQVNRQRLNRTRDLLGLFRVSVFSPEDLRLIKGSPGERRGYLDDVLVDIQAKNDNLRLSVDRILKQRNALLRRAGGRLNDEVALTLDVWDAKLTEAGTQLAEARQELVRTLTPTVAEAYEQVSGAPARVELLYKADWAEQGLAESLLAARSDDLRRGLTTVGPHRDDLEIRLDGLVARLHASQGEQRSLALTLRLAAHREVTKSTGSSPVLLLDDVFSELDPVRSGALLEHLPEGQAVLTTAAGLPPGAAPAQVFDVANHQVSLDLAVSAVDRTVSSKLRAPETTG